MLRASLGETALLARTPELWAWKHRLNPFGPSIVLVAVIDGRIAGVRALMRWDLVDVDGTRLRCVRAVDTATHPDFQRRGIFRALTLAAIEVATASGIDLIFNTPNDRSGAGYLTMGWREVGTLGAMLRPKPRMLWTRRTEDEWKDPGPLDVAGSFPSSADRPPHGLRTPRTAAYLAWRYRGHPTARYVVASDRQSAIVARLNLRNGRRELVVSDLLGPAPGPVLRRVLASHRGEYAVGWFAPGTPERAIATRSGMIPVPGLTSLTLFARPLTDGDEVFDLDRWDLSLGDVELL